MASYEWSGDVNNLPALESLFSFHGELFVRKGCPCGCDRPFAVHYLSQEADIALSILMRRDDPGNPAIASLLANCELITHHINDEGARLDQIYRLITQSINFQLN